MGQRSVRLHCREHIYGAKKCSFALYRTKKYSFTFYVALFMGLRSVPLLLSRIGKEIPVNRLFTADSL